MIRSPLGLDLTFVLCPAFSLEGSFTTDEITFPAITRKRYGHYFVVGFIVPSRIGARCVPLYRKIYRAVFFKSPGGCSCGGVVLGRGGGLFFFV